MTDEITELLVERGASWGDAVKTHVRIAQVWSGIFGFTVNSGQVALAMEGLKLVRASINPDDLLQRLMGGEIAVALMSKGHFTNNGHFILLRGVTLDGQVLVADSASPERSLTPWDLDLILDELASRRNSASLWMVSSPESTLS